MMKLIVPSGAAVDMRNIPFKDDEELMRLRHRTLFGASESGDTCTLSCCLKFSPRIYHLAAQLEKFLKAQEQRRLKLKSKRKRQKKNRKAKKK